MKRIIVPTDFSDISWNATVHALVYCRMFEAELLLVHIYTRSTNNLNTNYSTITASMEKEDKQMKKVLSEISALNSFKNVNVEVLCLGGSIYNAITNVLKDTDQDLLIMGTKCRKGSFAKLFSSNTCRLIQDLNCPILLVPEGFKFSLRTPTTCALDHGTHIKNDDLKLLEQFVKITSNSVFKIIHVVNHPENPNETLPVDQFNNLKISCNEIVGANVSELLENYSVENKSRLMVLVKKEKGFFEKLFHGSILDEMTSNAQVPLLVLRSQSAQTAQIQLKAV